MVGCCGRRPSEPSALAQARGRQASRTGRARRPDQAQSRRRDRGGEANWSQDAVLNQLMIEAKQRVIDAADGVGMQAFQGRHVLLTGGSTGIGLATARLLARRGAKVFLLARGEQKLAEAAASIKREGGVAGYGVVDVSDRAALRTAIEMAEATFGPVEALF